MSEFEGRSAIVTGGSRGIGSAIVRELASRGAKVAFNFTKNQELADQLVAEIQAAVTKGDKVSITGFGVFEKRVRAARMARNPRTGETIKIPASKRPKFTAGKGLKDAVNT